MEPGHEDREYLPRNFADIRELIASMEPGHEDREYNQTGRPEAVFTQPQWSPVMKTGNTAAQTCTNFSQTWPQWSPVMKTGNTTGKKGAPNMADKPQWSPVMKTGNTRT